MVKKIKVISIILIFICFFIRLYIYKSVTHNVEVQNRIIDQVFHYDNSSSLVNDNLNTSSDNSFGEYLGYIFIPKFNIKCVIKNGTNDDVLNAGFVGIHGLSGSLGGNDMIILAGHNISNVFSKLHSILNGDHIFINSYNFSRKFIVYDKRIVNEYDISHLLENRKNELLLITCTKKSGERLLVFLKEVL